jgi:acyl-CoA reductase-like NAD-dependent aldehyde dehydrogenase
MTVRQPLGVAGLISPPNTPAATVAWKVFPAVLCGNGVALKAPEGTSETALVFARLGDEAGLPAGIFNVVQGDGEEAEQPLVEHEDVAVVSFTGSTAVGRMIARVTGRAAGQGAPGARGEEPASRSCSGFGRSVTRAGPARTKPSRLETWS